MQASVPDNNIRAMHTRRAFAWLNALLGLVLILVLAMDVFVLFKRDRYRREIDRLRGTMSQVERERTDLLLSSREKRTEVMMELIRRQSRGDADLHLAISLDSGMMRLQREGAVLRNMPVRFGAERIIPSQHDSLHLAVPLGTRTIQALLTDSDRWEVPSAGFADRGEEEPENRNIAGALGPYAIVLSGGTVIYSLPAKGPLADSSYIMPAAIRAQVEDLRAVFPNLRVGLRVYFY
jgi:hypothetical protein